ncbi:MAG: tRNA-dihydrouridine synthase [Clostridium sp.]
MEELLSAEQRKVHKPVTVKFRKGSDDDHVRCRRDCEDCTRAVVLAASLAVLPGRAREQYYSGRADWGYHPSG